MGGSSGSPTPPDYAGAAAVQGRYNILAALASAMMNNPNINNPYGSQKVSYEYQYTKKSQAGKKQLDAKAAKQQKKADALEAQIAQLNKQGKVKKANRLQKQLNVVNNNLSQTQDKIENWKGDIARAIPTLDQTLNPKQQKLLDTGLVTKQNVADTGVASSAQIKKSLSGPLDLSRVTKMPTTAYGARNDVINAMMARVNQDLDNQTQQTQSDLIARGIRPGTEAWGTAMRQIDQARNDARNQAILAGGQEASRDIANSSTLHNQGISDIMTQRQTPLNELNALQSGSQINNPFAGGLGFQAGTNIAPTDYQGAVSQQYNANMNQFNNQQAQKNANMQAGAGLIGSLGSSWLGAQ